MSSKKLIALITINWKRYDLTKKLFISLQNSTVKPDTYLVDNECDASKVADVAPYCREVFKFRENTGYSFANNHAAKKIGRNYEYLLFINKYFILILLYKFYIQVIYLSLYFLRIYIF